MKTKVVWIIVFIVVFIAIVLNVLTNKDVVDVKPVDINVGDEFTAISYSKPMYVLNYVIGNITGDNVNDMAIVLGSKQDVDSLSADDIDVVVYDSNSSNYHNAGLKKYSGEVVGIELVDFINNSNLDIMVKAQDKEKNYNIRILSFDDGEFKEIFKQKNNLGVTFSGSFLDGFKANVKCRKLNIDNLLSVDDRRDNYVLAGLFDESGKLLKTDVKISTTGFSEVEVVQLTGSKGLKTTQRIIGLDDLDILDEIEIIWKFEDGKWQMKEVTAKKQGNLLY